jgi:hypothetical protein
MEALKEAIQERRNIKPNSIRAYLISIKKIHNAIFTDESEMENVDFLTDDEKVYDAIKDLKLTTQKNYLSAIIVALDATDPIKYQEEIENYRDYLDKLSTELKIQINTNEKTEEQEKNWVSMKQLKKVMNKYKADLNDRGVFKMNKDEISKKQKDILQMWVVANLYLHNDNPPVRLDYGDMRVIAERDYNEMTDDELKKNYLVVKTRAKKYFHFGDYKTHSTYGNQSIPVGKILNSVLNIWIKFNDSGYLLVDTKNNGMNSNQLSKYINKVFQPTGKKVSATLLRHIYLSENHPVAENQKKIDDAQKMLHSIQQQNEYAKL